MVALLWDKNVRSIRLDDVFNPRSEVSEGDIVLGGARYDARHAAETLIHINQHGVALTSFCRG